MKEKIAEWLDDNAYPVKGLEGDLTYNQWKEESTEQILTLLKQEIEKVENELIFIKTVPSMGDDL